MRYFSVLVLSCLVSFSGFGNEYIVKFDSKPSQNFFERAARGSGFTLVKALVPELNLYLVKDTSRRARFNRSRELSRVGNIGYAHLDHKVTRRKPVKVSDPLFDRYFSFRELTEPDDPRFKDQWSLKPLNDEDAHIQALSAWEITKGGTDRNGHDIVVAVVDGGGDVKHMDLVDNLWVNKREIPGNGLDDDDNGYVDDIHGWNVFKDSGEIREDDHGTHVAGIVAARGDNGKLVTGINWNGKVMFIEGASSRTSEVLEAYGYVLKQKNLWLESKGEKGANVVATNSSFGIDFADCDSSTYKAWNDIYEEMGKAGILSAVATANGSWDIDKEGDVPSGCSSDYVVAVTNTNKLDEKHWMAAYGTTTIDLGAPGTDILSTVPGDYVREMTGTSMATPHVAGAIALMYSATSQDFATETFATPGEQALKIKELLLSTTKPIEDLEGRTVSGGRLDLLKAVEAARDSQ